MHHTQANAAYGHQIQNHQQTSNPHHHQQQSYAQPQQHSAAAFGQITSQAHYEHHHQQQHQAAAAQAHAAQIAAQAQQQQRQHQEQYSYGTADYQQPTTEHQSRQGQQGQSREGGQNIRWQQQNNGSGPTGTTAERRLPFVHRFHRNQQNQGNQGNVLIQPYPHGQQGGGGGTAGGPQGHQGQGHHNHHHQGGQANHHHHPHHHRTPQTYHQQVLKQQEKRARNMAQYETNPIGALQERFQSRGIIPDYKFLQTEGQSHCPSFTFQVTVGDITSSGNGNTKKQAKQAAAKSMLDILDGRAPSGGDGAKPTTAEGGEAKDGEKAAENGKKPAAPQVGNKIGMLQEFCVTKGLPMPVYDVQNVGGQPHQRVFTIGVKVGSLAMTGEGTSKKDSKREAAEKMYEKLKELGQGALPMINGGGKLEPGSHPDNSGAGGDFNKIDTLTGKHRDQIGKFFGDLGVGGNSVMTRLHKGPVVSVAGPNFVKFLKDLAEEQKFAVTYVEMDEPVEGGGVMSLVQISSMPVAVCTGMGPNLDAANNEASKSALLYLKMMTKKKALTEKEQANAAAPPAGGNENKSNGRKKK